ncbi:hypothetical protein SAMN05216266_10164 [Amycolatopsis marina]|uniref:DUF3995 domain-containing protein n=1 Tax=Amycolatopsis marina TaxID=490629 RepID=A0A1I0V7U4_9PSEU|nr:hypothetical protein [Amycolatopsis marina]SFA72411.1 hypothetical protein SAMN05216266_10164 [Amycolatopsis marina]
MTTTARQSTGPAGPTDSGPSGRARPFAVAALAVAVLYGALRTCWQLLGSPTELSARGGDLIGFTGWSAIGLCAVAALAAGALATLRLTGAARTALLVLAMVVSVALLGASAMLLLDVVGGILPGLGIRFYPLGALSRAACVGTAVLLMLATLAYRKATHSGCPDCGRGDDGPTEPRRTPAWAYWAAYLSVAGCVARIIAQLVVGMDQTPVGGGISVILFEVGFVLGGTLLPLALVHTWGLIWPRWLPRLAGRRVPRWLVLGPGIGISAGLVVYFGLMLLTMAAERLQGRNPFPPSDGLVLPEAFFWISVPAYLLWGLGMAGAALSYQRRTRPTCVTCAA